MPSDPGGGTRGRFERGSWMNAASISAANVCAVDMVELLARCVGRADIAERVLKKFRETIQVDIQLLEQAFARNDSNEVALIAHRIKGAALAIAAHPLCNEAAGVETAARAQQLDEGRQAFARLQITLAQVAKTNL